MNNEINPNNLILATDSYKVAHKDMYPEGTEAVYSYFESRAGADYPYTVFFGLQYIIQKYLLPRVTQKDLDFANMLTEAHFGRPLLNYEGWQYIVEFYKGSLPILIKAVPEGTRVPTSHVMMTVENKDPQCFWLTNYIESLLTHIWYPSTVATKSHHTLNMIQHYVEETGGTVEGVPFMLHDFGYRGASSHESAAIGGAGHLLSGRGTDTLPAMVLAMKYYDADLANLAFSVPATEHSVMTSLGPKGEPELVLDLLDKYPTGILSVVGDSYDIYEFTERLGYDPFFDKIKNRDGKLVVRPDSGDPVETMVKLSRMIWDHFGGTTNARGFHELDPHVGLLWGDGIEPRGIEEILDATMAAGFCSSNYVFGMGGGLLQKVNRDTQRFAFKCSAQKRNGEWIDIYKDPLDSSKASKRGRFQLERNAKTGHYYTTALTGDGQGDSPANLLKTVFHGYAGLGKTYTFDEVRANLAT